MTTNPDVLRLARDIVKQNADFPPDAVSAGHFDGSFTMKCAIAAIERTAQLNADHLDDIRMPTCAKIVRSYYALRQPEKGSTDE